MSATLKATAIKKSIFNAANLSGLAAIFLSYSMGSLIGTFIFIIAVIVGSLNKYRTTINRKHTEQKGFLKILNDPSLTAQILMVAALINFFKTGYDGFLVPPSESLYFVCLAIAWFLGFLGDNSLRRNDKTNFSFHVLSKRLPLWIKTFIYVTRNPVFYYTVSNIFFSVAVLLNTNKLHTIAETSILETLNILAIVTALTATFYGLWRGIQMIQEKITSEQTNDGVINFISIIVTFEIGAMAAIQGLYWVVVAMALYAISNIVHFYETRHALQKEHS